MAASARRRWRTAAAAVVVHFGGRVMHARRRAFRWWRCTTFRVAAQSGISGGRAACDTSVRRRHFSGERCVHLQRWRRTGTTAGRFTAPLIHRWGDFRRRGRTATWAAKPDIQAPIATPISDPSAAHQALNLARGGRRSASTGARCAIRAPGARIAAATAATADGIPGPRPRPVAARPWRLRLGRSWLFMARSPD